MTEALENYQKALNGLDEAKFVLDGARTELGKQIREARLSKDIPLREIARQMDVSAPYVYDVETGRRTASNRFYTKILKILA